MAIKNPLESWMLFKRSLFSISFISFKLCKFYCRCWNYEVFALVKAIQSLWKPPHLDISRCYVALSTEMVFRSIVGVIYSSVELCFPHWDSSFDNTQNL